FCLALLHPCHRGIEPVVGAMALEALFLAIVEVTPVDERPVELGRRLLHPPAEVVDAFLKALVHRPVWIRVAEVPLAEDARVVTGLGEDLRHRWNARSEESATGRD